MTDEEARREELWQASHILLEQLNEERERFAREAGWREEMLWEARAARQAVPPAQRAPEPSASDVRRRSAEDRRMIAAMIKTEVDAAVARERALWIESVGQAIGALRQQIFAEMRRSMEELRTQTRAEVLEIKERLVGGALRHLEQIAGSLRNGERRTGDDAEPGPINGAKVATPRPH
jgi:hypothetical protein